MFSGESDKVLPRDVLIARLNVARAAGQCIVCTNGVFDLMHIGHLRYLQAARALGDVLLVGVNSDNSTRRLKGPTRPLVPQAERAELLAGLACVDLVTIFDEDTAEELVRVVQPHIYVKGGDYTDVTAAGTSPAAKPLPEANIVRAQGGDVVLIPYISGHSTSALIETICRMHT
jgi:D-glycero-beta-D-manno-heptose 1-phosphate adenylyltransferase